MSEERLNLIITTLKEKLTPLKLEVIDESYKHVGHSGAKSGKGHFRVNIVSNEFKGSTIIQRQRLVYNALDKLLETDIHAISMSTLAPGEEK